MNDGALLDMLNFIVPALAASVVVFGISLAGAGLAKLARDYIKNLEQ